MGEVVSLASRSRLLRRWLEIWWLGKADGWQIALIEAGRGPVVRSRPLRFKGDVLHVARGWSSEIGLPVFYSDGEPIERDGPRAA